MAAFSTSDTCFRCHQVGHWAKDCLNSSGTAAKNNNGREKDPHFSSPPPPCYSHPGKSNANSTVMPNSEECSKWHGSRNWAKDYPSSVFGGPNSSCSNDQIPAKMCSCGGGPCLILTSSTQKNPGRKFYKCSHCRFFEWCDRQVSYPSQNPNSSQEFRGQQTISTPTGNGELGSQVLSGKHLSIRCPCRAGPCPVKTAKTERNSGRQFLVCPIRKGEGSCGFFKWCDEME